MDLRATVLTTVEAALRAAGARGRATHPDVTVRKGRVRLVMWGGPDAHVVGDALAALVAAGTITSLDVEYRNRYTCGAFHESPTHAWWHHEGRDHLTYVDGDACEMGCSHGDYMLDQEALVRLVAAGETFTSQECVPLDPA